jgi:hypothetical protein
MSRTAGAWRSHGRYVVETDIPNRLDRLPWSRLHRPVIASLGAIWTLDGLVLAADR